MEKQQNQQKCIKSLRHTNKGRHYRIIYNFKKKNKLYNLRITIFSKYSFLCTVYILAILEYGTGTDYWYVNYIKNYNDARQVRQYGEATSTIT